jgi:hypothetical protein
VAVHDSVVGLISPTQSLGEREPYVCPFLDNSGFWLQLALYATMGNTEFASPIRTVFLILRIVPEPPLCFGLDFHPVLNSGVNRSCPQSHRRTSARWHSISLSLALLAALG